MRYGAAIRRAVLLTATLTVVGLVLASPGSAAVGPVAWCGNDQSSADRTPDAINGLQIHVIYAFPADGADNSGTAFSAIATDLANVDAWWNGQDPTRKLRFDQHGFPGCGGFGALDISRVQLPNGAAHYQPFDPRFDRLIADLTQLGFTHYDKKYLVYYDGPVDNQQVCGIAENDRRFIATTTYAAVFIGACSQATSLGTGDGEAAITAVHELTHSFNALAFDNPNGTPPNTCPPSDIGNPGHPCDNPVDLLAAVGAPGITLSGTVLDAGRDDYYAHGGPWTDVRNSPFLIWLDSPDAAPPISPNKVVVKGNARNVTVSWPKGRDDVGPVRYRVYKNGFYLTTIAKRKLLDRGRLKQIITYGVRAVDSVGRLGPLRLVRFKVGFGIVNANRKVTKDTVGPSPTKRIRFSQTATTVTLRWAKSRDTVSKIRDYLVKRNGKRVKFAKKPTITVAQSKAKGRWTVQARDRAGNLAAVTNVLTVS